MIVVIDSLTGNLGSIINMLNKIGASAIISSNISDIEKADKLIMPGVGSFDSGMKNIHNQELIPVLQNKVVINQTPILGICLGMQMFTNGSEEGNLPGLGWLDAETVKFKLNNNQTIQTVPHMGWNTVKVIRESALFDDMYPEPRFYFVHSYHVVCHKDEDVVTKTFHGYDFASAIQRGNIVGVQFHPEKSHKFGMKLLKNFVNSF